MYFSHSEQMECNIQMQLKKKRKNRQTNRLGKYPDMSNRIHRCSTAAAQLGREKKEMLNDTNYFPLINMIDCQALTLRGEGEKCVKGKFAQTSLVFLHLKINQKRLGSLILSFVYLMGCCRIYGCN